MQAERFENKKRRGLSANLHSEMIKRVKKKKIHSEALKYQSYVSTKRLFTLIKFQRLIILPNLRGQTSYFNQCLGMLTINKKVYLGCT